MTLKDRDEFIQYLRQCSDRQVRGVFDKEHRANRTDYAELAHLEMGRRNIEQAKILYKQLTSDHGGTPPETYPFCRRDPCPYWFGYCRKDPACND